MARPRLPDNQLSKWGVWKRNRRARPDLIGKPNVILHHPHAQHAPGKVGKTTQITRAQHAAHHNRLRRRTKTRVIRRTN